TSYFVHFVHFLRRRYASIFAQKMQKVSAAAQGVMCPIAPRKTIMDMKPSEKEIISMFQRYLGSGDSSEIDKLDLENLVFAEERISLRGINPQFLQIVKNKIHDLELKEARQHESKIRALTLVTGLILGVVISGIAAWLFNT
ncbi:hypothetical protein, partial [Microbulbifer mangrovi]|uniref:hypothetical protein n=1 Tax=Microbulbifer mangrovi TaxID=927787 RepID=UPI0013010318